MCKYSSLPWRISRCVLVVERNRGRLIKSVVVQMGYSYLWITVVIPELIHATQVLSEARARLLVRV